MFADFELETGTAIADALVIDSAKNLTYTRNNHWRYKGENTPVIYFDALVKPQAGDYIVRIAKLEHIHIPRLVLKNPRGLVDTSFMEA